MKREIGSRRRQHERGNFAAGREPLIQQAAQSFRLARFGVGLGEDVFVDEALLRQRAVERELLFVRGRTIGRPLRCALEQKQTQPRQQMFEPGVADPDRLQETRQQRVVCDGGDAGRAIELAGGQRLRPGRCHPLQASGDDGPADDGLHDRVVVHSERDGAREMHRRFFPAVERLIGDRDVEMKGRIAAVGINCLGEQPDGVIVPVRILRNQPEQVERVGLRRVMRQDLPAEVLRLGEIAQRVVPKSGRDGRRDSRRGSARAGRWGGPAALAGGTPVFSVHVECVAFVRAGVSTGADRGRSARGWPGRGRAPLPPRVYRNPPAISIR